MSRKLLLTCTAVTLFVLAQGQIRSSFCISNTWCTAPNSICSFATLTGDVLATNFKIGLSYKCQPFTYSYLDENTKLWKCPNGLQGSASWGPCCPPLMELVNVQCKCINNLVETKGACGCSAPLSLIGSECRCPDGTRLTGNPAKCEHDVYAVSIGGGAYACPKGARSNGDYLCVCSEASTNSVSNGALTCSPIPGASYDPVSELYTCGPDQYRFDDYCYSGNYPED